MDRGTRALRPRYDSRALKVVEDPYPVYASLRQAGGLARGGPGQWVVSRHEDVATLLADRRLSCEYPSEYRTFALGSGPAHSFYERIVLYRDGSAHARLREQLRYALKSSLVDVLNRRLPHFVDELIQPALEGSRFDIVKDFAIPLSFRVMCELIGFPKYEAHEIRHRSFDLSKAFGTLISDDDRIAVNDAVVWLREFTGNLLEQRRHSPREDGLSRIVRAESNLGLPREHSVDNVAFLLFAGFETTANLLGSAIAALLEHPDVFRQLRTNPALAATAAEECLRYDPPIQGVARVVRHRLTIRDNAIREGRVLVLLLGSANRDEAHFVRPDKFDLIRSPNPHLSFGGGAHYCLGAPLARMEITAVLSRLLACTSNIASAGTALRQMNTRLRGYAALPVEMRPAGR
jgi:cytochrome P450